MSTDLSAVVTPEMRERWRRQRAELLSTERSIRLGITSRSPQLPSPIDWHDELFESQLDDMWDTSSSSGDEAWEDTRKLSQTPRSVRNRNVVTSGVKDSNQLSQMVPQLGAALQAKYKSCVDEKLRAQQALARVTLHNQKLQDQRQQQQQQQQKQKQKQQQLVHQDQQLSEERKQQHSEVDKQRGQPTCKTTRHSAQSTSPDPRARPCVCTVPNKPIARPRSVMPISSMTPMPCHASVPHASTNQPRPTTAVPVRVDKSQRHIASASRPVSACLPANRQQRRPLSSTLKSTSASTAKLQTIRPSTARTSISDPEPGEYDAKAAIEAAAAAAARVYYPVKFDARLVRQATDPRETQQELIALREGKITLDRFPHLLTLPARLAASEKRVRPATAHCLQRNSRDSSEKQALSAATTAGTPGDFTLLVRSAASLNSLARPHDFDTTIGGRSKYFSDRKITPLPGYETRMQQQQADAAVKLSASRVRIPTFSQFEHVIDRIEAACDGKEPVRPLCTLIKRLYELCRVIRKHSKGEMENLQASVASDAPESNPPMISDKTFSSQLVNPRERQRVFQAWVQGVHNAEAAYLAKASHAESEGTTSFTGSDPSDRSDVQLTSQIAAVSYQEVQEFVTQGRNILFDQKSDISVRRDHTVQVCESEVEIGQWVLTIAEAIINAASCQVGPDLWDNVVAFLHRIRKRLRVSLTSRIERVVQAPDVVAALHSDSSVEKKIQELIQEVDMERNGLETKPPKKTMVPQVLLSNQAICLILAEIAVIEYLLDLSASN